MVNQNSFWSPTLYPVLLDSVRMTVSVCSLVMSSLMLSIMAAPLAPPYTITVPEFWMVKSLPLPDVAVPLTV